MDFVLGKFAILTNFLVIKVVGSVNRRTRPTRSRRSHKLPMLRQNFVVVVVDDIVAIIVVVVVIVVSDMVAHVLAHLFDQTNNAYCIFRYRYLTDRNVTLQGPIL